MFGVGGSIPLLRTGGAPERTEEILDDSRHSVNYCSAGTVMEGHSIISIECKWHLSIAHQVELDRSTSFNTTVECLSDYARANKRIHVGDSIFTNAAHRYSVVEKS